MARAEVRVAVRMKVTLHGYHDGGEEDKVEDEDEDEDEEEGWWKEGSETSPEAGKNVSIDASKVEGSGRQVPTQALMAAAIAGMSSPVMWRW
ncbi:uncharacterized protein GLRG_10960 [Colletotrichum graminicola M1.001]|uniref:Uncharacterized protein n=1 Tax=Colletotrichum graminicola (strain M1.001 / M2 / FGSC 10212) TaxID=645133 RepID=E3QYB3_COLGM|nr:uncharacterized protein GLRG_10960 [Colletotrichum graminicola M1.001]EFQ35851.1 hypothetical protein GLRG_10960 [Colletotrichum graminicola M1.001]